MPNWCSNHIEFTGARVNELKTVIEDGKEFVEKMNQGWLPSFLPENTYHYLFDISDIYTNKDGSISFSCESKWSPPTDAVVAICKHFDLSVNMEYCESGMGIFGRYFYNGGAELDFFLDQEEIDMVEYDIDTDCYIYQGKTVDSDMEIYEKMLDDKIKRYYAETFDSRLPDNSGGHDTK